MFEVVDYLQRHLEERLTCAEVAKRFGYSVWHFCLLFRQYTGTSFVAYLRHFRMQRALNAILDGASVTDTAMKYGYDTLGGFEKAFLSEFGEYPRAIVKSNREKYMQYQERRKTMNQLSDRCAMLRDDAMNVHSFNNRVDPQYNFWDAVANHEVGTDEPYCKVISRRIALLCDNMPAIVREGELLVGNNFGTGEGWHCRIDATKEEEWDKAELTDEQKEHIRTALQKPRNGFRFLKTEFTEVEQWLEDEWVGIGRCNDSNHSVLSLDKVVTMGFEGLLEHVRALKKDHPENPGLYEAAEEICLGGCRIGARYAEEAERQAKEPGVSEERRAELVKLADVLHRVPRYPARDLQEAAQAVLFAHFMNTWEDYTNANSLGRLDQILYPYYKKQLEEGTIDEKGAFEIICCLWVKLYLDYDVQQSCVGGCHADGSDAVNPLSWIMLDATEQLNFIRCMSVRFSSKSDKAFLHRALEVVGHVGKGVPFFFNDDVMIPALVDGGVSLEDARDYTQIGCVETVIPGKSNPHAVTGEVNMLKGLELALTDGYSMIHPERRMGISTGDPAQFDTYEKFYAAVCAQIEHIFDLTCNKIVKKTETSMTNAPRPYKSLLTEGCLESGRDFNSHGAKYDYYEYMFCGIPNLADSLAVVRKFVYQDNKYTLPQVVEALKANFPDEKMRQEFINKAPKYGNDIDEVDSIAVDLTNFGCDLLEKMSDKYGLKFYAQPFTFLWMIEHGQNTGATPDGRRSGEIIAYSVSPMQGRDFSGFLALMNSICKMPTKRTPGTTSAIVEVDPKLFSDYNLDRFAEILQVSAAKGLSNVQFNTISLETLNDAKEHPENHCNLAVRVSGFSQKFNLLRPELQDHIIERTKHQCL